MRRGFGTAVILLGAACRRGDVQSPLDPAGPHAGAIAGLWPILLGVCTVVWIAVMVALVLALRGRPGQQPHDEAAARRRSAIAVATGATVTIVTLFYLLTASVNASNGIASLRRDDAIVIDVISRRWWWDVRYRNPDFVTANEIHIPTGVPVRITTTSADVIHSVWVPQLGGKIDSMPGHRTSLWMQADRAGVYRGQCAEFCGLQHAHMALLVIAHGPEQYAQWVRAQAAPAVAPPNEPARRGRDVFFSAGCPSCHLIRGESRAAAGDAGPDLTHLASRETLAAVTVPNRRGHLAGWITDPHSIKPGTLMPPTNLSGPELNDLLAYLESLR